MPVFPSHSTLSLSYMDVCGDDVDVNDHGWVANRRLTLTKIDEEKVLRLEKLLLFNFRFYFFLVIFPSSSYFSPATTITAAAASIFPFILAQLPLWTHFRPLRFVGDYFSFFAHFVNGFFHSPIWPWRMNWCVCVCGPRVLRRISNAISNILELIESIFENALFSVGAVVFVNGVWSVCLTFI
jgi:hypothetical protein